MGWIDLLIDAEDLDLAELLRDYQLFREETAHQTLGCVSYHFRSTNKCVPSLTCTWHMALTSQHYIPKFKSKIYFSPLST